MVPDQGSVCTENVTAPFEFFKPAKETPEMDPCASYEDQNEREEDTMELSESIEDSSHGDEYFLRELIRERSSKTIRCSPHRIAKSLSKQQGLMGKLKAHSENCRSPRSPLRGLEDQSESTCRSEDLSGMFIDMCAVSPTPSADDLRQRFNALQCSMLGSNEPVSHDILQLEYSDSSNSSAEDDDDFDLSLGDIRTIMSVSPTRSKASPTRPESPTSPIVSQRKSTKSPLRHQLQLSPPLSPPSSPLSVQELSVVPASPASSRKLPVSPLSPVASQNLSVASPVASPQASLRERFNAGTSSPRTPVKTGRCGLPLSPTKTPRKALTSFRRMPPPAKKTLGTIAQSFTVSDDLQKLMDRVRAKKAVEEQELSSS